MREFNWKWIMNHNWTSMWIDFICDVNDSKFTTLVLCYSHSTKKKLCFTSIIDTPKKNQQDYFTKGLWILFIIFALFHMKDFLNKVPCNLLLICISFENLSSFWIIQKYANFIRFFKKKNLSYKLQLCFVSYAHHTPLTCNNVFWIF